MEKVDTKPARPAPTHLKVRSARRRPFYRSGLAFGDDPRYLSPVDLAKLGKTKVDAILAEPNLHCGWEDPPAAPVPRDAK